MFEIKLLDIIQTFTIGILTITLVIFIYFIINKYFNAKHFKEQAFYTFISNDILKAKIVDSGLMYIGIIAVYMMGIITSDLTERMTDTNNKKERPIFLEYLNNTSFMPDISEIRRLTIIGKDSQLTTLGQSVIKSKTLVLNANRILEKNFFITNDSILISGNAAQDSVLTYISEPRKLEFDKFITLMFYQSKNWCYRKNWEPLNELKSAQIRQDLSRSVVLLVGLAGQVTILLFVIYLIINLKQIFIENGETKRINPEIVRNFKTFFFSLLILLSLSFTCRTTYQTNLLNFNKRAFGYFLSYTDANTLYKTTTLE